MGGGMRYGAGVCVLGRCVRGRGGLSGCGPVMVSTPCPDRSASKHPLHLEDGTQLVVRLTPPETTVFAAALLWPSECDDGIKRAHVSRKQRATASRGH